MDLQDCYRYTTKKKKKLFVLFFYTYFYVVLSLTVSECFFVFVLGDMKYNKLKVKDKKPR